MIVYHAAYDLQFFYDWNIDVTTGFWKMFQVCVASLFLIVSGISAGFWTRTDALQKRWKRGWTILSAAMLVSLVTAIMDSETWIRFGILHLIALSSFVLPFLRRLHPFFIALLGIVCIALGPLLYPPSFSTLDYIPPFPWLGPVLLGFAIGIPLSARPVIGRGQTAPARLGQYARPGVGTLGNILAWPGRYSLWIYVVHQPVILTLLWLVLPHP